MRSQGVPGKREALIPSAPVCALGQLPLVSKGSLWVLPSPGAFAFFNNIFMRANSLWRAVPKRTDCAPKGGSEAFEENRLFSPGASPDPGASARPPPTKTPTRICRERHPRSFNIRVIRDRDSGGFGFLADTRIGLFGNPATFAPGKSDSGRCFSLKQEGFKLLRLPN